jgi:hypothetical protein
MANFILFLDVTIGRLQKLKPIISNLIAVILLNHSWHVFYATRGLITFGVFWVDNNRPMVRNVPDKRSLSVVFFYFLA